MLFDRERWREQVVALEGSGLSRAAFCRRHGINYHTMTYWVSHFREQQQRGSVSFNGEPRTRDEAKPTSQAADTSAASFVEVTLPRTFEAAATYEVQLGNGRSIRLGAGFDDAVVARLIRTLESC